MGDITEELASHFEAIDHMTEMFLSYKMRVLETTHSASPFRMNPTKFHILKTVYRHEPCMVMDIARKLQLSSGATTIALNQLEEDGLIVRLRSEEDRRTVRTMLSEQGRSLIVEAMQTRNRLIKDMLEPLTGEEREQLFRIVGKISGQLERKIHSKSDKI